MKEKPAKEIPKEIEEVRERIEEWRRTRPKVMAMPDELWQAAVSLARKYTPYEVALPLRLNVTKLKERMLLDVHTSTTSPSNDTNALSSATFVSLPPPSFCSLPELAACLVQMEATDGARLSFRLPAANSDTLLALADSFWRRNPCCK